MNEIFSSENLRYSQLGGIVLNEDSRDYAPQPVAPVSKPYPTTIEP